MKVLAAAVLLIQPAISIADGGKSVYGEDDRLDYYAAPADMRELADSVVSLWRWPLVEVGGSDVKLVTQKFADSYYRPCPEVLFRDQPLNAFCSGALVGRNLVMTAGHCVMNEVSCRETRFVFGFRVERAGGEAVTTVPAGEVYGCDRIVAHYLSVDENTPDYALIKLDRKVRGHKPLPINRGPGLKRGDPVFVIGHPVGLPLKVAGGATVRTTDKNGFYETDLDAFGGNSGSPVFNAVTKRIEGILVRGDDDFSKTPEGCYTMAAFEQAGGRGEDVTRVSELAASIPPLAGDGGAAPDDGIVMMKVAPDLLPPAVSDAVEAAFD